MEGYVVVEERRVWGIYWLITGSIFRGNVLLWLGGEMDL